MPSIARFQDYSQADSDWYVLCDPFGRYQITDSGRVDGQAAGGQLAGYVGLLSVLVGAVWAASGASSFGLGILFFILGGIGGMLTGVVLAIPVVGIATSLKNAEDRASQVEKSRRVDKRNEQAWRVCQIAAKIAETGSWADNTVDASRRVPAILWSVTGRSILVDQRRADAKRALEFPALQAQAQEVLARVKRECESIDAVEENLKLVLAAAVSIDRQRIQIAREKRIAHERMLEERELRGRLSGGYGSIVDPSISDTQADSSAGLVAEAETVARLLAESDRLLRDTY